MRLLPFYFFLVGAICAHAHNTPGRATCARAVGGRAINAKEFPGALYLREGISRARFPEAAPLPSCVPVLCLARSDGRQCVQVVSSAVVRRASSSLFPCPLYAYTERVLIRLMSAIHVYICVFK